VVEPPKPPPPPAPGEITLELSHTVDKLTATFKLEAHGMRSPLTGGKISLTLPANVSYQPGSATLDGAAVPDPAIEGATLTFLLGAMPADWARTLGFRARTEEGAVLGAGPVTAALSGAGGNATPLETVSADNALEVARELLHKPVSLVLRPHFPTFGTELSPGDKKQIVELERKLVKTPPDHIVVVGHTDSQAITKRGRKTFKDNAALSLARAKSVGSFLLKVLKLKSEKLDAEGKGDSQPLALNATRPGRALNRRVEVSIFAKDTTEITVLKAVKAASGPVRVETHLMPA
jgi:outer membrane protein OmpA-like peptidoglycan-associated protein